jgi:hypothetical protein
VYRVSRRRAGGPGRCPYTWPLRGNGPEPDKKTAGNLIASRFHFGFAMISRISANRIICEFDAQNQDIRELTHDNRILTQDIRFPTQDIRFLTQNVCFLTRPLLSDETFAF